MQIILFNKPYHVLSQFTDRENRSTLADYIQQPGFYPAGRLDYDSEGLLLLTDSGELQSRISDPAFKLEKAYWAQVEGKPNERSLAPVREGIQLRDGKTRPAKYRILSNQPPLWSRQPAIAKHRELNSSWVELRIIEGRNRQVRRMLAYLGFPVLRLVRHQIGNWQLDGLQPGQFRHETVHLPSKRKARNAR